MDNNNILLEKNSTEIVELANKTGIDPIAALAIFGIESDFGRSTGASGKGAKGKMQVTEDQFNRLKTWFQDPANLEKVVKAYGGDKAARTKVAEISTMVRKMTDHTKPMAGITQLIYNKAIGLDKSLWGAGYQGNADRVLSRGQPLGNNDGNITNSDYNRAYVTLYNHILNTHGRALLDKNKTLAGIDNNLIPQASAPVSGQPPAGGQAGLVVDANIDTSAQSTNTGNVGITEGADASSLAIQQQATGEPGIEDMSLDNIKREEPKPPAFYQEDPTRAGFDLQNNLDQRKLIIDQTNRNIQALTRQANYIRRLAEVERRGGFDPARYDAKIQQSNALAAQALQMRDQGALAANEAEKTIVYLQGMQGLQDLQNGSTNRAAAVWSLASGQNVKINSRSDGRFDVLFNNKPFKTYDMSQLSDTLQLTFSDAFRKGVTQRAAKRFEAEIDIWKQGFKDLALDKREKIKGIEQRKLKILEAGLGGNTKLYTDTNSGATFVIKGDEIYGIKTETSKDLQGNPTEIYSLEKIEKQGAVTSNAYKREKS